MYPDPPQLLKPQEVADRLHVSASTARGLMRSGAIAAIRTGVKGKLWRTSAAALQGYMERQRHLKPAVTLTAEALLSAARYVERAGIKPDGLRLESERPIYGKA